MILANGLDEDRAFEENIGLVKHLMKKRYKTTEKDYDDVFQEGCIGLLHAVRNFNPDYGFKFSSYAAQTIMGKINNYYRDRHYDSHGAIREVKGLYFKIIKITTDFSEESLRRVSTILDLDYTQVEEASKLHNIFNPLSFDYEYNNKDEHGMTLSDLLATEEKGFLINETNDTLERAMKYLDERQKQVVVLYYLHELSQAEIGEKIGTKQVQVSRILSKAKNLMRLALDGSSPSNDNRVKTVVTHEGKTLNLNEWSKVTGIPHSTLKLRLSKGWSLDKVFAH